MKRALLMSTALLFVASAVSAAPGWPVTRPPVVGPPSGPDNDPRPAAGQWFIAPQSPLPQAPNRIGQKFRPWELYDDSIPQGGGWASFFAIKSGNVVNYYDRDNGGGYGSGADGVLDTFGITVIVTNDCPATNPRPPGTNLHQETWTYDQQWVCEMFGVKVTAEFSVDLKNGFPAGVPGPYVPPGPIVYQAVNHDELAWYSHNADPVANFWVPTWDLGVIPHDMSAAKEMQFYVGNAGLLALGMPLRTWLDVQADKFYNRTRSLKISDWVSPHFGPGAPYDSDPLELSNVSVFFIPEPMGLLLICAGAAGVLRRRR